MQARNHENSDEIRAQPVRHLDLATPAFYTYRKNPKCYHTVWGKRKKPKTATPWTLKWGHWTTIFFVTCLLEVSCINIYGK